MKPIPRRAFIRTAGAAVAATTSAATILVEAATPAAAAASPAAPTPNDDRNAIQQLHHTYVARLNNRQQTDRRALFASAAASEYETRQQIPLSPVYILGAAQHLDTISIAPDRQRATARFHCLALLEETLSATSSSSLIEMARQQGQGVIQRWEHGILANEYVKEASLWKIARVSFHPTTGGQR